MEFLGRNDIKKSFFEKLQNKDVANELQKFKTLKDLDIVADILNEHFLLKSYSKKFDVLSCRCVEHEEELYKDFQDFFSMLENEHVSVLNMVEVYESYWELKEYWLETVIGIDEKKINQVSSMIGKDEFFHQLKCLGVDCVDAGLGEYGERYILFWM